MRTCIYIPVSALPMHIPDNCSAECAFFESTYLISLSLYMYIFWNKQGLCELCCAFILRIFFSPKFQVPVVLKRKRHVHFLFYPLEFYSVQLYSDMRTMYLQHGQVLYMYKSTTSVSQHSPHRDFWSHGVSTTN